MRVILAAFVKASVDAAQVAKWLYSAYLSAAASFIRRLFQTREPETLLPIIKEKVTPESIVYTDAFRGYNALEVSDFHHRRINHSNLFAHGPNLINRIDNFWNQAKRHIGKFNAIKQERFYWFLKVCEWPFNGGNHEQLLKHLKYCYKHSIH